MSLRLKFLTAAFCAAFLSLSSSLHAQTTKFFMYSGGDDFPGGTEDATFKPKQAAEILSWRFSAENTLNLGNTTGGSVTGKATFNALDITFVGEPALLPKLFGKLAKGEHYPMLTIEEVSNSKTTMKTEMHLAYVESIEMTGTQGDRAIYVARIRFGAIQINTFKLMPNGTIQPAGEQKWSVIKNNESTNVD